MGYGKDDELAINTIRLLAVHPPPAPKSYVEILSFAIGLP